MTDVDPTRIDLRVDPLTQRMIGTAIHGDTPFDVPYMSKIAHNLWSGGCATGLVLPSFVKHLISLYPWESYTVKHSVDSYLVVRMYDSDDSDEQGFSQVTSIAEWVNACRSQGPTLVHCQAGLNRSGLVVARALTLSGMTGEAAIAQLREKRSPACLCNPAFEEWITTVGALS